MNAIQQDIFVAALRNLSERINCLVAQIEGDDSPDISAFDDTLEVVLEARNKYCASNEMNIENGEIDWSESEAQAKP